MTEQNRLENKMRELVQKAQEAGGKVKIYRDNAVNVELPNNFVIMTPARMYINNNIDSMKKMLDEHIKENTEQSAKQIDNNL